MKYPKVCDKALDRIDKIKKNETEFLECLKYKICPDCGDDDFVEYLLYYECNSCGFKCDA